MRLINTKDFSLKQIANMDLECQGGAAAPKYPYGILSHRWEEVGEPTFQEYISQKTRRPEKSLNKIKEFCRIAQGHGLDLVWVDTCCIDKRSSTELQETINSMYRIYERAQICFAYLRDVSVNNFDDTFVKSEWFNRGWTLQELLAPTDLRFYDSKWEFLGDKQTLSYLISLATGIQEDVLIGRRQLRECSVAQRMSWAATRVTTLIEDRAYSLLGIFDVNMPMLYGEGSKSFLRLQEEIIKTLDDASIFVWKGLQKGLPGLLASSPDAFASSGDVRKLRTRKANSPFVRNNRGLHGHFTLIPYTLDTYMALLPCSRQDFTDGNKMIGIFLRRLYEDDQFIRVPVLGEELMEDAAIFARQYGLMRTCLIRSISIRQSPLLLEDMEHAYLERIQGFRLNEGLLRKDTSSTLDFSTPLFSVKGAWNSETRIVSLEPGSGTIHYVGSLNIAPQEREIEIIRFGFDLEYNPVVFITQKGIHYSMEEDERGVFMQHFERASEGTPIFRSNLSAENFQIASPAVGGSWSRHVKLSDGKMGAQMSTNVNGFWALRGDRVDGLDVPIVKAARYSGKNHTCHRIGHIRLKRAIVNKRLTWDLQLDQLAPRSVENPSEEIQSIDEHDSDQEGENLNQLTSRLDILGKRVAHLKETVRNTPLEFLNQVLVKTDLSSRLDSLNLRHHTI